MRVRVSSRPIRRRQNWAAKQTIDDEALIAKMKGESDRDLSCPRPRQGGAENDYGGPKMESGVFAHLRAIPWGPGITGKRGVGGAARERKIT